MQNGEVEQPNSSNRICLSTQNGMWHVSFLEYSIVRMRFIPKGSEQRELPQWNPVTTNNIYRSVEANFSENANFISYSTNEICIQVEKKSDKISIIDSAGNVLLEEAAPPQIEPIDIRQTKIPLHIDDEELPSLPYAQNQLIFKQKTNPANYYGLGQRAVPTIERFGEKLTNWTTDPAPGHAHGFDNLYQSHPVLIGLTESCTWGYYINTTWYNQWDIGHTDPHILEVKVHGDQVEAYFIYGPTPANVLEKLTGLTGRPMFPPLWGYGYHQCRWSYFTASEVESIASEFRARQIPIDVIHLDIDYMDGYRCFTWNPKTFSNPIQLVKNLNEQKIRVVTIIDPGIKHEFGGRYKVAKELSENGGYIRDKYGAPFIGNVWPDRVMFPDFSREDVRVWWGENHRSLLETGVAGIWQDMNEPANFMTPFTGATKKILQRPLPLSLVHGSQSQELCHAEVHNAYGYLMSRATYDGLKRINSQKRPWALTRSGMTGIQKYAIAWMGDNSSWWEHMEVSIQQAISMGLCGMPNIGVDIGGFWENCTPELYARWVQLGTFYPFMRTHSSLRSRRQEPWVFGKDVEAIARSAIELRYQLLPYLYSLGWHAHLYGHPLIRPMFFDFMDDKKTWKLSSQFMVGGHICVAPILRPGEFARAVYLPQGNWFNFWTGEELCGNQYILADAPLEKIPIFIRAGAVIPLGNIRQSTTEKLTEVTLHSYPSETETPFVEFFEDDGESFLYENGLFNLFQFSCIKKSTQTFLKTKIKAKKIDSSVQNWKIKIYKTLQPKEVTVYGKTFKDWMYDKKTQTIDFELKCIEAGEIVITH